MLVYAFVKEIGFGTQEHMDLGFNMVKDFFKEVNENE